MWLCIVINGKIRSIPFNIFSSVVSYQFLEQLMRRRKFLSPIDFEITMNDVGLQSYLGSRSLINFKIHIFRGTMRIGVVQIWVMLHLKTPYLLFSPADSFCKQLGPRSGPTERRA